MEVDGHEIKPGHIISIKAMPKCEYRNLGETFSWTGIPKFAVITGKNGVGKTALLSAIRERVRQLHLQQQNAMCISDESKEFEIELSGDFIPQLYANFNANFSDNCHDDTNQKHALTDATDQSAKRFANYLVARKHGIDLPMENTEEQAQFESAIQTFEPPPATKDSLERYNRQLNDKAEEHWKSIHFRTHVLNFGTIPALCEELRNDRHTNKELNLFLSKRKFKYKIQLPEGAGDYPCIVVPNSKKQRHMSVSSLSSGEQVKLMMLLWQYCNKTFFRQKREVSIMLLDEPDAHLQPDLVSNLIRALKDEFVNALNVQVIMTTHNPTTISMVKKENIFLMEEENDKPVIRPATSTRETNRQLLPSYITVLDRNRTVFVKDSNDKRALDVFYQIYQDIHVRKVDYDFNLQAVTACKSSPTFSVETLFSLLESQESKLANPFVDFVFGIVSGAKPESMPAIVATSDNPSNTRLVDNMFYLKRNSVENYLYDPVYLYFAIFHNLEQNIEFDQQDNWKEIRCKIQDAGAVYLAFFATHQLLTIKWKE